MSETVIREVAKNVWIFSHPFARYGFIPMGGRSTAIRMENGGVWILASTPLNEETKATLDSLGPVKFIIGADAVHHLFLGQYKKAYPSAKLIAPKATLARTEDKSLKLDGAWGRDPPGTLYGFEDEIKTCYFEGFKNKDVVFFHQKSKTIIEADLLLNLPCNEQYSKAKSGRAGLPFGNVNPWSWFHPHLTWSLGINKEFMKRDVRTVASWDFERIIPCHGDVIEERAKDAWMSAQKFYFQET